MLHRVLNPGGERAPGIRLTHKGFPDEKRLIARGAQAGVVGRIVDAALGHEQRIGGKFSGELKRSLQPHIEGAQVAIVHTEHATSQVTNALRLLPGVDFAEHIEGVIAGGLGELFKLSICKRGNDEQDCVCSMDARFDDLVLVEDEVLAQAGDGRRAGGGSQIREAALEKRLVR
jgi:hypothetical protein